MYGQLLMASYGGSIYGVHFNICQLHFFDWNNLLTFQVQHIDGIFSGTILNYMKAVLFSDSDDADADDGDTNDQGSQYVFNQSDILHFRIYFMWCYFYWCFIVFIFIVFELNYNLRRRKKKKVPTATLR
eukprot:TRINITY_DN11380_c0_g1_i1.p1 TRINITY_DN11380_c0_g1~~TRINITY_DN11380_c0_g1_i1.p1  ORF type:complete len:129 (-),score=21.87 TRINITY_DN11380_c0_g1_i1:34-420(-)